MTLEEVWQWVQAHRRLTIILVVSVGVLIGGWWGVQQLQPAPPAAPVALTMSGSRMSQPVNTSRGSRSVSRRQSATGALYVDVKGAVRRPGLYQVRASMRVADVIALAQGLQPEADQRQVNLAAKVSDQQVIYVPTKGESHPVLPPPTAPSSTPITSAKAARSGGTVANHGPVNINSADVATFQQIKGIGQKKAQKIIDYRQQHGPFKRVEDLKAVSGFGEKTIAKFKDQLTV
ncbi:ComEA family DNA-binding protein [Lactiplantibacillus garii]|uniref:ComEA family DNA-binding protein n=1 Tax=Lactiplantibacillus garii TaxID=2306423 RepID=A0A3R8LLT9_9LACO|nr:ComEA family DNA-binding protein [Lactiplantibacillus garii]RRK11612.1 ComEA family DNA-binding protein [Lactiplantibacillus garii]